MIDALLRFSLRRPAVVVLGAVVLFCAGLWSAFHLPIDAVPDITGIQVQINTEIPALAAEESEIRVTQVIEQEMAGLPGVEEMRSLTKFGLSQVTLQFNEGTDIYRARQLVTERLQAVTERLPRGAASKLAPISTGLGEIFYYSLNFRENAPEKPATERDALIVLSETQEYVVKPLLRTVPGIAEINSTGGYEKQFVIEPRPAALAAMDLTFTEFAALIGENLENAGGGLVTRGTEQLTIRSIGRISQASDLANLPLRFSSGTKLVLVGDVAEISVGIATRTGAATLNGHEAVVATTMMLSGENSREVAQRVKARIAEIQGKLPAGIEIRPEYDRSELVGRTIQTVETNLMEGAVLVAVVLLLLLGNYRGALIVAAAIPLSFCFALIGMARFGISGNLMSLGAIDFGLIIDGAVVMVENIVRQLGLRQHQLGRALSADERRETVLAASRQVATPMVFGVTIIAVVYLPVLALTGIEGKMFHPMALTVMLALGGALVLSVTAMPALCSLLLRGRVEERENAIIRFGHRLYRPLLERVLPLRWWIAGSSVALLVASAALFQRLGAEFVPTLDEGSITIMFYKPVGISVEESVRIDRELEGRALREFPEVTRIFSRIGTSEVASDPMPVNESDVYVTYRPLRDWPKTAGRPTTKAELVDQLGALIRTLNPDYGTLFAQPIEMRFNELLEGTKAELALKIFGPDFDVLDELGEKIKALVERTPGVAEVEFETEGRPSQLQITARHDVLRRYGVPSGEINRAVTAALAGERIGELVEGNRRFDVIVRLPESLRQDEARIRELPLRVGEHGMMPLGEAAVITVAKTVEPIRRDSGQRRAALMIDLATRDIEGFVRTLEQRIAAEVPLPPGYTVEFGGQFKNLQEARTRLGVVVPSALLLILVLIYFAFGSIRQALLIYTGIPLAATGGIAALWLRDMPFSITAAVGFIALTGVAVLNGVVLVSTFNQLRREGADVMQAVRDGALTRLRPVLMTAAVASLGFLPMALASGAGAEVQRPLATVVIGGIVSSTLLTLIVVPSLYAWLEGRGPKKAAPKMSD